MQPKADVRTARWLPRLSCFQSNSGYDGMCTAPVTGSPFAGSHVSTTATPYCALCRSGSHCQQRHIVAHVKKFHSGFCRHRDFTPGTRALDARGIVDAESALSEMRLAAAGLGCSGPLLSTMTSSAEKMCPRSTSTWPSKCASRPAAASSINASSATWNISRPGLFAQPRRDDQGRGKIDRERRKQVITIQDAPVTENCLPTRARPSAAKPISVSLVDARYGKTRPHGKFAQFSLLSFIQFFPV